MESAMLDEFMKENPDIKVQQIKMAQDSWDQGLFNLAATGDLPDAYTVFDLASATANQWTLDITDFYNADAETANIPAGIKQAGVYNNVRYGLATWQFPVGVFVNKTLFNQMNQALPKTDWTLEDMVGIARKMSVPKDHIFGLADTYDGIEWLYRMYPVATTNNLYEWGFDPSTGKFDLTSWAAGYALGKQLVDEHVTASLTNDQRAAYYGSATLPLQETGKIAMSLDWFWTSQYMQSKTFTDKGIQWLVYPQPTDSGRIQSVIDLGAVASTTKHPKEAYELLKFMTYGASGWSARLDYCTKASLLPPMLPITSDQDLWTKVEAYFPGDDYKALFATESNWVAEARKWTPGYGDFWTWTHEQDIFNKLNKGLLKPTDLIQELNTKYNGFYDSCMALINARKK